MLPDNDGIIPKQMGLVVCFWRLSQFIREKAALFRAREKEETSRKMKIHRITVEQPALKGVTQKIGPGQGTDSNTDIQPPIDRGKRTS